MLAVDLKNGEVITMTKDLTKGSPMKLIISFAVPLLFGFLFQQFYNLVDTMIVGRFLGVDDLAAVGSTGSINFLVIGFCMGVCNGFAIPVSHKFGAGDYVGMRKYVANCAWLGLAFSVIMTVVTAILCRDILVWMKTPANIIDGAHNYIFIIFIGIPTVFLYNIVAGVIRATGDSKTPVVFLVLSSIINIVLDLYFIISLHMGVAGAAWATVISQGVSGVACLVYMVKKFEILRIHREEWKVDGHMMMVLCGMGVPMGLQYSITAIGGMMVQSSLNILGSYAVAAFTAGSKIDNIFTQAFVAIGTTMSTYSAQNVGARKLDRVRQGFRCADVIGCAYAVVVGFVLFFVGKSFSYLFISDNAEAVIPMVDTYLRCVGMFMIPLYVVNCYRNGFQGMGYGLLPMLSGVAELIGRGVMAVVAADARSYTMACMASPFAWIVATVLLIVLYFYVMKDMKRKLCLQ